MVSSALARLCLSFLVPKIWAVKFAVKLRSCRKRWFWGFRFVGEGVSQISDMHFRIALTCQHVAVFG